MKIPNLHVFTGLIALILSVGPILARAAPYAESQTQLYVEDGQDFLFTFDALPSSDGTGATLTIATGTAIFFPGIDLDFEDEFFEVTLDGVDQGLQWNCFGSGTNTAIPGAFDVSGGLGENCEFSLSLGIDAATLDALIADESLIVGVNFSAEVTEFDQEEELIVTLGYETDMGMRVAEPASLAMLGLGFTALTLRHRRKSKPHKRLKVTENH